MYPHVNNLMKIRLRRNKLLFEPQPLLHFKTTFAMVWKLFYTAVAFFWFTSITIRHKTRYSQIS